jgi:hypothetical protein
MNTRTITFWHSGIDRIVTGIPTGNVHATIHQGNLVEIRWMDGKGTTYTTHVREANILSNDLVA